MRRLALVVALAAASALAAGNGIAIQTGTRFEFTDCSASGSASQALVPGKYLMRVTDENVFVCWAGTCASPNGEKFPVGAVVLMNFSGGATGASTTISCRSAGATGDVIFTKAD